MAVMEDEPFFHRVMRELAHCEETALTNPAQMLQLLTGQESLHRPFILVKDCCQGDVANSLAAAVKPAHLSRKHLQISQKLDVRREQQALKKSVAAVSETEGIWSLLPQLELKQHPKAVLQLLFDIFLGCIRPVDDLRRLTHVKRAIPSYPQQFGVLMQTIGHVAAAIRAFQPIQVDLVPDAVLDLGLALEGGTARGRSIHEICGRWVRGLPSQGSCAGMRLPGRQLRFLRFADISVVFRPGRCAGEVAAELAQKHNLFFVKLAQGKGSFWRAYFTAKLLEPRQIFEPDFRKSLVDLACQLCILVDMAASDTFASLRDRAAEDLMLASQLLAFDVMREFVQQKKPMPLRNTINNYRLQAELLGSLLPPQPQQTDARVPWPLDAWQVDLLDAVDTRAGALVLAPTSAGKTFAAYYAMESVLRASNTAVVLVVLPTATLAGQVEAEVYARFGQKPYPHDGFELCAALLPGRSRQHVKRAQIVVAVPQSLDEVLDDETLWCRISWVICDEIHMQPLECFKRLCERVGSAGSAILAMSATVQHPEQLRTHIAKAARSSTLRLVRHDERAVHLQSYWWNSCESRIVPLHPLLLQDAESFSKGRCLPPLMSPDEALQLWEAMACVDPDAAESLDLTHVCSHQKHRLLTRDEFRKWERCLAASLVESDQTFLARVMTQLTEHSPISPCPPALDSNGLLELLMKLRVSDMLPCICFHLSRTHLDQTLLELEAIMSSGEKARKDATAGSMRQTRMDLHNAWEQEVAALRQQLEVVEAHARDRLRLRRKHGTVAGVAKRQEDDFRAPEVLEQDHKELTAEASERANAADVSADAEVRAAKAALQAVLRRGPLDNVPPHSEFNFVGHRPQKVYAAEIQTLLNVVEAGINALAIRGRHRLWAQSVLGALHRGIALHIDDDEYSWINFAVLMLFRLGHVRVLLAGEALGCGVNLPCRTVVVLDSDIAGARLKQFGGRAGRRGLDLAGSVLFVQGLEALCQMHNSKGAVKTGTAENRKI